MEYDSIFVSFCVSIADLYCCSYRQFVFLTGLSICDLILVSMYPKERYLFKWVDEALIDKIQRVDAEQIRIAEEIEDLKKSLKKTVEKEFKNQKSYFEVGCLGTILWLFGRLSRQEWVNSIY